MKWQANWEIPNKCSLARACEMPLEKSARLIFYDHVVFILRPWWVAGILQSLQGVSIQGKWPTLSQKPFLYLVAMDHLLGQIRVSQYSTTSIWVILFTCNAQVCDLWTLLLVRIRFWPTIVYRPGKPTVFWLLWKRQDWFEQSTAPNRFIFCWVCVLWCVLFFFFFLDGAFSDFCAVAVEARNAAVSNDMAESVVNSLDRHQVCSAF